MHFTNLGHNIAAIKKIIYPLDFDKFLYKLIGTFLVVPPIPPHIPLGKKKRSVQEDFKRPLVTPISISKAPISHKLKQE